MRDVAGRARSLGARLLLLLVTFATLFAVGEAVVRVLHARSAPPQPHDAADLPVLHGLFDLVGKNVRGLYLGVLYRTNSQGIRGPERTLEPDTDTFRILIAGDSVTMGHGISEEEAYPQVLERLLNEAARPPRRFEVLNLGLAGVNATFASRRLANLGEVYQPDLLVYGFTINDIQGPHYRKLLRADGQGANADWNRALRFRNSPSHLVREIWPRWVMRVERRLDGRELEFGAERAEWYQNYFENGPAWSDFSDALARIAFLADSREICGHLLIHTYLTELGPEHPYEVVYDHVAAEARARGLGTTQSLETFRNMHAPDLWLEWYDSHPNAVGHEILARALFEGLREMPPACWRNAAERARAAAR